MDRRERIDLASMEDDPEGPPKMKNRTSETWEECHQVLVELETMDAATKQFLKQGRSGGGKASEQGKGKDGQPVGAEKGKGGKKGTGKGAKGPCFSFRDTAKCNQGKNCPYDHTPEAKGRV